MNDYLEISLLTLVSLALEKVDRLEYIESIERVKDDVVIKYKNGKVEIIAMPLEIRGLDGKDGEKGVKGDKGEAGRDGKDGKDGKNGLDGRDGKDGARGLRGERGLQGERGIKGDTGEKGDKGDKGEKGEKGSSGVDGKDGNGITNIGLDLNNQLVITTNEKTYKFRWKRQGGGNNNAEFFYTNSLPMPAPVGGLIAGTVFDRMPLKELLTKLLYGYDYPYFAEFVIGDVFLELEVGQPIDAGVYPALWLIANPELLLENSIEIKYVNSNLTLASNIADTGSFDVSLPEIKFDSPTQVVFMISATDTTGIIFNKTYKVPVKARVFVGESTESVMSQAVLYSLRIRELRDDINGEYILNDGGYKWFCYPAFMGEREEFFDLDMQEAIAMEQQQTVSIINEYGVTQDYLCYRSFNVLNGDIRIEVK